MKSVILLLLIITCSAIISSCKTTNQDAVNSSVISEVEITTPLIKDLTMNKEFTGSTKYTLSTTMRAGITGIITKKHISPSERIGPGFPMFEITPRESNALNSTGISKNLLQIITDTVYANSASVVNRVIVQEGDFVQSGDPLAELTELNSLKVVVSVPVEFADLIKRNNTCKVVLPPGDTLSGIFQSGIPTAEETNQAVQWYVGIQAVNNIPENIHVNVIVPSKTIDKGTFLPKNAIFGNEEQTSFWVIKTIEDTLAVYVPVTIGVVQDSLAEILEPDLNLNDHFVTTGGYALPDSAKISLTKN